jgi:uracil-DNA glycosylase
MPGQKRLKTVKRDKQSNAVNYEDAINGGGEGANGVNNAAANADDLRFPAHQAPLLHTVPELDAAVICCRACPRLVEWREETGRVKRKAFRGWDYWAKPVPGFGPPDAALAITGLAPAAHGGNRTGRIFTGDPSGDVLYAALHAVGLASQPGSSHRGDGLRLRGVRITVPVHCAPPQNRPTTAERDTCRPWLAREFQLLQPSLRAVVVLGGFAWQALMPVLPAVGWQLPRPRPAFGHGTEVRLDAAASDGGPHSGSVEGAGPPMPKVRDGRWAGRRELYLLGCYHPSQRNVSTKTVTPAMIRDVLRRGARIAGL